MNTPTVHTRYKSFIHILLLYGSAWTPGLRHVLPVPLGPGQTLVWVAIMLVSMSLIGWGWNWTKRRHRWVAWMIKMGVLGALVKAVYW